MSNSANNDTGIAILSEDLELLRVDKAYNLDEISLYLEKLTRKENSIICVDLPRNNQMLQGKWRLESKFNLSFKTKGNYVSDQNWADRYADRGSDLCYKLHKIGYDIYRFNCFLTRNALNLNSPYKSRSPAACKCLQMALKDQLNIKQIPSNMIPLSGLDAILGAYTSRSIYLGEEVKDYKYIGEHKSLPIVLSI